jgi:hypothetical protein
MQGLNTRGLRNIDYIGDLELWNQKIKKSQRPAKKDDIDKTFATFYSLIGKMNTSN